MPKNAKLRSALATIREWFESVVAHTQPTVIKPPFIGVLFGDVNEGTMYFKEEEAEEYRRNFNMLLEAVDDKDAISAKHLEAAFRRAVFVVADLPKTRSPDPKLRCEEGIRILENTLSSPLQRFRVIVPVKGLDKEGLPAAVGAVTFNVFGEDQIKDFRDAAIHWSSTEEEKLEQIEILSHVGPINDLKDQVVASVEVLARDWKAAETRAVEQVRLTLDVMNFFGDLDPYNHAHLGLPGEFITAKVYLPQLRQEDGHWVQYSYNRETVGSLGQLSVTDLKDRDSKAATGFAYADQLLRNRRGKLKKRLVAALRWAGRASVISGKGVVARNKEAFLLYAIALEAFLLADNEKEELSYRLRLRVAHLLGGTAEVRRDLFRKMGHLYKIRSNIVHSGDYEMADADFWLMKELTRRALVRVCTDQEFLAMDSPEELAAWFEGRVLNL
jgi:hypothetical protein